MFAKLLVVCAAVVVAAAAAAREYPAGVHPAVCPDYPYCDPATLARFTPDGQPIPAWGIGDATYYRHAGAPAAVAPAAARWPAGLDPALCPNYPYCW